MKSGKTLGRMRNEKNKFWANWKKLKNRKRKGEGEGNGRKDGMKASKTYV